MEVIPLPPFVSGRRGAVVLMLHLLKWFGMITQREYDDLAATSIWRVLWQLIRWKKPKP